MSRFEKALHYVISSTTPEELGRTKLAKVMFFADLESFRRTGKPITEARYEKRQFGPMPSQLYDTIETLAGAGKIAHRKASFFGKEQHQFWSLEEPDLEGLTANDVATLAEVTKAVCENHTAASISEVTHNAAWELAELGEEVPFSAFMAASQVGRATADELATIEATLGA